MTDPDPIDTAWRIHTALTDWTGKVDSKASFALAIESAAIAGVINLSQSGSIFHELDRAREQWSYWVGVGCFVGAVLLAVAVVFPQLRRRHIKREWKQGFIYFGHLRRWEDPDELTKAIQNRDLKRVLSRQLIHMSEIAWKKHGYMQGSLVLALLGSASLVLCAYLAR